MFTKATIIMAFFNAFLWMQIHQIDNNISVKSAKVQELKTEIQDAQKTFGLAETQEYVEKIGLTSQMEGQIADLEQEKAKLKSQMKESE